MTKDPEKRRINNARYYAEKKARQQGNNTDQDHNALDVNYW